MESSDKQLTYCLITLFVCITIITVSICHEVWATDREAMKAGLIQQEQPLHMSAVWTRK